MLQKLKSFLGNDLLFHSVLLILVSAASFGFGRLSAGDAAKPEKPLISSQNGAAAAILATSATKDASSSSENTTAPIVKPESAGKVVVVGSKTGTKYHLPDCPGAKRIKPANLITFDSVAAANAAGYSPASNCKF
jgi:hypothetical protein